LNDFMAEGKSAWTSTRERIQSLLGGGNVSRLPSVLQKEAVMHLPCRIGNYTDFYASEAHATNVGTMFRGASNALNANWKCLPVGYHGRASSVVVSGSPVVRPCGLVDAKTFRASEELDFELELAALIGVGNQLGERISVDEAIDHIFGFVLMNDWSARDIQRFEYVPLGPFLGKNFLTSISPWVVTMDALRPHLLPAACSDEVADYLRPGCVDVRFSSKLEVKINGELVSTSNSKHLYWSFSQMVAHHTVNGCNLQTGDLLGSGTISGPNDLTEAGSLLELSWNKTRPVKLGQAGGERFYLLDGDEVELSGCIGEHVDFGVCTGKIVKK
jgi:fumarylacetoacetase